MQFSTPLTDAEWEHWLTEPRYNPYRVLLVQIYHRFGVNSIGQVRLASDAFTNLAGNTPLAWDDWLTRNPVIRSSVGGRRAVGEVDAMNLDDSVDWLSLTVQGENCTWFYGDSRWAWSGIPQFSQFRQIAKARVVGVRALGGRSYRFDLSDDSASLETESNPTVYTEAGTHEHVINDAINSPAFYTNVPQARLDAPASMEFGPNRTKASVLEALTNGIGAMSRITDDNRVEVLIPAPVGSPDYTVTEDDIVERGVREISVRPAYAHVDITYANDDTVRYDTTADPNRVKGVAEIETGFVRNASSQALADTIAAEHVALHGEQLRTWQIRMRHIAQALRIGHRIDVVHEDWTGTGIVTDIRRSPTAKYSLVEVEEK